MKILDDITVYICQDARRNNKIYDKTRCLSYQTYLVYFHLEFIGHSVCPTYKFLIIYILI